MKVKIETLPVDFLIELVISGGATALGLLAWAIIQLTV